MDDPYQVQRRAIADLQAQLALLPPDDPQRPALYEKLCRSYRQAFAVLSERIKASIGKDYLL